MVNTLKNKNLLSDLNEAQSDAVTHTAGPLLIVAGAGTGKTTVITRRIAWLIEQGLASHDEILALTFTDKAAGEMEERVDRLLPLGYVNLWVSTFHAFAERVLKDWALEIGLPNDFKLITPTEQWLLVKQNLDKFDLDYYRPLGNPTKFVHALLRHFSRAKDEDVWPEDYLKLAEGKVLDTGRGEYLKKNSKKSRSQKVKKSEGVLEASLEDETEAGRLLEIAKAYHTYQKLLLDKGALDFGDLINYTLKLFRTRPKVLNQYRRQFKYLLVDEFQDTNYAQYELVKMLAAPQNNITVVGDDDQSVYKFRGASISNILEFKQDYPKAAQIILTQNYRSTQNILDLSYKFIQLNNPYRLEVKLKDDEHKISKQLSSDSKLTGEVDLSVFPNMHQEASGVIKKIIELKNKDKSATWNDFAILARANASAETFLQELKKSGIPYEYVASKGLYQEDIILDIVAYLKLLDNYHESQAVYRVLTTPYLALPNNDLSTLLYFANRKAMSLYEALREAPVIPLSEVGQKQATKIISLIEQHSSFAREHTVAEVYLKVVREIGLTDWLTKQADDYVTVKQASYLNAFYRKIQEFELASREKKLNNWLEIFALELEAGEEGVMPSSAEEGPEMVKVITVHSAKGLEFKYVFIVHLVDRRFPSTERREAIELPTELTKEILPEGDVHLQEERRLFYVAMTRAKYGLYFSYAEDYFGKQQRKPSRFLYELGLVKDETSRVKSASVSPSQEVATVKPTSVNYKIPESFSFSSISSYLKCPLEYKYRYLLKIPAPGNAYLSFGSSMHKTLELFMKLWQGKLASRQLGLFGEAKLSGQIELPTFKELLKFYDDSWIDDWYESKTQRAEYKERGKEQLKNFYDKFKADNPQPKYLEQFFKLRFGDYKFSGKIDRMDVGISGLTIIDYKTSEKPPKTFAKVDKDQLLIYQLAAQEFFREKVAGCKYYYLHPNTFSDLFLGTPEELEDLRARYLAVIKDIVESVKTDNFATIHKEGGHDCEYLGMR
ncbi:MAG: ATP-dependent DNA helicase [Patescibacteria group bacterium]